MKLGHIELFVRDVAASREFYRDVLGCQVLEAGADRFVWVRLGQQEILLRPDRRGHQAAASHGSGMAFVLYTDDVEGTAAALERKGAILKAVEGEERRLGFTDPDGHWFQLAHPGE